MQLNELSRSQYLETVSSPMTSLGDDAPGFDMGDYVRACLEALAASDADWGVPYVYQSGDRAFMHVVIDYEREHSNLVVVVDLERQQIHGHYLLGIAEEYGLARGRTDSEGGT